jgi:hypothetical protein
MCLIETADTDRPCANAETLLVVVVAVAASSADSATILHVLEKGAREMEMEMGKSVALRGGGSSLGACGWACGEVNACSRFPFCCFTATRTNAKYRAQTEGGRTP